MFNPDFILEYQPGYNGIADIYYDISSIHPEWNFLLCRFEYAGIEKALYVLLESSFEVEDKNGHSNLSHYSREEKRSLWQAIFGLKEFHLMATQPDIVEHFIGDEPGIFFNERFSLYQQYLNLEGYSYLQPEGKYNSFWLVKDSILQKLH